MTDDSWFGVTPEPVATCVYLFSRSVSKVTANIPTSHIAVDLARTTDPSKTKIVDIFAGIGGNTIAFALSGRWEEIIAVENDASAIACGQHNASVYGVSDKITWVKADCFSYMTENPDIEYSKTIVFASPPWGGPGYSTDKIFNLATMQPYSLKQVYKICRLMDSALYLPRTSDLRQISKLAADGKKIDVVQYCMKGASKALVAYIPTASVQ
jgi:trimethylguanosine synthase